MDSRLEEILAILKAAGAVLVRKNKHRVYRMPDGRMFVLSATPSDGKRGYANALCDLKHRLGLYGERGTPGKRRERKPNRPKPVPNQEPLRGGAVAMGSFCDKLAVAARAFSAVPAPPVHGGKKIVHPVFGSHQRKPPEAQPIDLSCLVTRFTRKAR